ncbi:HET domain containing protein [Hyaloscypha variabilis]
MINTSTQGMNDQKYIHRPLLDARSIRVLALEPAHSLADPLHCRLDDVSLDDASKSPYNALSYVWGARTGDRAIQCEGRIMLVTESCELALRYLRHESATRTLWVDAICINQQSVAELNQQVPLMADIYRLAEKVTIWLGVGSPECFETVRKANLLYATRRVLGGRTIDLAAKWYAWGNRIQSHPDPFPSLCEHSWFKRIWTLQEFIFAQSPVVMVSKHTCTADALEAYFRWRWPRFLEADRHRGAYFASRSLVKQLFALKRSSTFAHAWIVIKLLQYASPNEATEPADKIYGLISLLRHQDTEGDLQLPVIDYSRPVQDVHEDLSRQLIRFSRVLWTLQFVGLERRVSGLPSWVADWNLRFLGGSVKMDLDLYTTTRKSEIDIDLFEASLKHHLALKGQLFSTVSHVSQRVPAVRNYDNSVESVTAIAAHIPMLLEFAAEANRRHGKAAGSYEGCLATLTYNARGGPMVTDIIAFTTESGHLSVTMAAVQVGDVVVLFAGAEVPFILRRKDRGGNEESAIQNTYVFVGPAIVHRIMDGEAWPEETVVKDLETFILE